jgi:nicotinate dehydrogenase subunit A
MIDLKVNGQIRHVDVDPSTPLLYVLREDLDMHGAKFGCGLGQCGACTVNIDGKAALSCVTPVSAVAVSASSSRAIVTVEGLGTIEKPGLLQQAFEQEQAAQCGYCIAGMIMRAQPLLERKTNPSDNEIRQAMVTNLCRCGTHMRILRAVRKACDSAHGASASGAAAASGSAQATVKGSAT